MRMNIHGVKKFEIEKSWRVLADDEELKTMVRELNIICTNDKGEEEKLKVVMFKEVE